MKLGGKQCKKARIKRFHKQNFLLIDPRIRSFNIVHLKLCIEETCIVHPLDLVLIPNMGQGSSKVEDKVENIQSIHEQV